MTLYIVEAVRVIESTVYGHIGIPTILGVYRNKQNALKVKRPEFADYTRITEIEIEDEESDEK